MKPFLSEFYGRLSIDSVSRDDLDQEESLVFYGGFDPTADGLHIGNLVVIMGLLRLQRLGHRVLILIGGATALVGDPSGKSKERPLLSPEQVAHNAACIQKELMPFFDADTIFVNNLDWFTGFSFLEFLRDVGKSLRMGPMLAKESVKTRLSSTEGMSFTEFSYQALQAHDFCELNKRYAVNVQVGGSDQWGNITAGMELLRKKGIKVDGMTFPLLTRSDGAKFGKSAEGAIFLSADKVSDYAFYQYFLSLPDADMKKLFSLLTFLETDVIDNLIEESQRGEAQKRLAEEVLSFVRGKEALDRAQKITACLRPGAQAILDVELLEALEKDLPSHRIEEKTLEDFAIADHMLAASVVKSKGDARRLIANRGVFLNNVLIESAEKVLLRDDFIGGRFACLSLGKKRKLILSLQKNGESS